MALVITGPVRIPGPFGTTPVVVDGAHPTMSAGFRGPAGYRPLYDTQTGAKPAASETKTRTRGMPALPEHDNDPKQAHRVDWNLYDGDGPKVTDVRQGGLATCPLAALLAAMANTAVGKKRIKSMIEEHGDTMVTDLSEVSSGLTRQAQGTITSPRYFTVKFVMEKSIKEIEVSDVFFTDTTDDRGDWSRLLYMQGSRSSTPVLWACVIEKAYAQMLGGYGRLEEQTLDVIWKPVTGSAPAGWIEIDAKTNPDRIRQVALKATVAPAVAASKDEIDDDQTPVTNFHGYAMLKVSGAKVDLYDPWGKGVTLTPLDIKKYFKIILYG